MQNVYISTNTKHRIIVFSKDAIEYFKENYVKTAIFTTYKNIKNAEKIIRNIVGSRAPCYAIKQPKMSCIIFGKKTWGMLAIGVSGASGIKCKNIADAYKFLYKTSIPKNLLMDEVINSKCTTYIYTDGSCNQQTGLMGVGYTIYGKEKEISNSSFISGGQPTSNKAECISVMMAIDRAIREQIKDVTIVHDNQNVQFYAVNKPKHKNNLWTKYHQFIQDNSRNININFEKCKAHSGDEKNNSVDKLVSCKNVERILDFIK